MELKNFDVGSIDWIVLSQDLVCNQWLCSGVI
jgi:hypothetical protein